MKFRELDCLTGYSVFLMLNETIFIFMLNGTNFVVICSYVIWYVINKVVIE